jgi:hypothetical protein
VYRELHLKRSRATKIILPEVESDGDIKYFLEPACEVEEMLDITEVQ